MLSPKPFASLSSGLLARKGQARPAMRRQGMATLADISGAATSSVEDDLGWNDMGSETAAPAIEAPIPNVLQERAHLEHEFAAIDPEPVVDMPVPTVEPMIEPVADEPAIVAAAPVARVAGAKAAFTLRLDAERHLRLRLASATRGVSAQQIVTQALDALLQTMPEVEKLRGQLPAAKKGKK